MGVNRINSTRVTSVVLIHTQDLLATRGSLRDHFTEKLVKLFVYNDVCSHLTDGHRDGRRARFLEKWLKLHSFSLQVFEAVWTTWIFKAFI